MSMSASSYAAATEALRQSPLFNAALASKELFHSNFLAWLIERRPEAAGSLFAESFGKSPRDWRLADGAAVGRERNNFDLVVPLANSEGTLVIENKVKSIPTQEQLRGYAEKAQRLGQPRHLLLLTLGSRDVDHLSLGEWRHLTYGTLSDRLARVAASLDSTYHAELVRDEARMVAALAVLADADIGEWPPSSTSEAALRIHDLIGKRAAHRISERLIEALHAAGKSVVRREAVSLSALTPGTWWCYSDLTRGEVLVGALTRLGIDVELKGRRFPVALGIQIQGRQFRHYVEFIAERKVEKKSPLEQLAADVLAGSPSSAWRLGPEVATGRRKEICSYDGKFFYRYQPLEEVTRGDALIERVLTVIQDLEEARPALRGHVVNAASKHGLIAV